jgi:hypothetical protein
MILSSNPSSPPKKMRQLLKLINYGNRLVLPVNLCANRLGTKGAQILILIPFGKNKKKALPHGSRSLALRTI